MTSTGPSTNAKIVVGVDGSPTGELAVHWAAEEAHVHHRALTLVHTHSKLGLHEQATLNNIGVPLQEASDQIREEGQNILERARNLAVDRFPDIDVETTMQVGDARSALLELSEGASLVVVGSRGHGQVAGLLLGSVSGAVVRHAPCPVAVVHAKREGGGGVLAGADGSEASFPTLDLAYAEASARKLPLTVLHCLWEARPAQVPWSHLDSDEPDIQDARERVTASLADFHEKYPDVSVHVSVAKGAIDSCLVELSERFDLLVIGRAPRSLGEHVLFNGVTTSIAEHAHAPAIVVP